MTARRSSSGFTLVELMIAASLALVLSGAVLALARSQLIANGVSDQVASAQQNARAGSGFVESLLRRACSGVAAGAVGVNVPGAAGAVVPCVRVYDGAILNGGSFTASSAATLPDALEVIYGTGTITAPSAPPTFGGSWSISVVDRTGFQAQDLVLVGDWSQADLFKVSSVTAGAGSAGTLNLAPTGGAVVSPPGLVLGATSVVVRAASVSVYLSQATTPNLLMYDPDGMIGADHTDAQPLVEGAIDFQIAVGVDGNADGVITEVAGGAGDEWIGNAGGEVVPAPTWNRPATADPLLRQVRLTLVTQTARAFSGAGTTVGPYEDRTTYPAVAAGSSPRFRALRVQVAPRIWNLTE